MYLQVTLINSGENKTSLYLKMIFAEIFWLFSLS